MCEHVRSAGEMAIYGVVATFEPSLAHAQILTEVGVDGGDEHEEDSGDECDDGDNIGETYPVGETSVVAIASAALTCAASSSHSDVATLSNITGALIR